MTDTTRTALLQLATALAADPAAMAELSCYGDLPQHIADAVSDLEGDDEDA